MNTKPYGPYSSFRVAGEFVYTAGQVGAVRGVAPRELKGQAEQALKNLNNVLEKAGCGLADVIKTTVYLTDMSYFAEMNEIYAKAFEVAGSAPARTCVAVAELPRVTNTPLLIEIEAIAHIRKPGK